MLPLPLMDVSKGADEKDNLAFLEELALDKVIAEEHL